MKVTRGRVTVRDLARKRTRVARAGHSVTVRAERYAVTSRAKVSNASR